MLNNAFYPEGQDCGVLHVCKEIIELSFYFSDTHCDFNLI